MSPKKNESYGLQVVKIRMVKEELLSPKKFVQGPSDAVGIIADELSDYDREVLCVVNLRTDNSVINMNIVSMGTLNSSIATPREIFKSSILSNAAGILLLHNHPSGNPVPSVADYEMTNQIAECGRILDIPLVDHVIVAGQSSTEPYSFMEHGDLDHQSQKKRKRDKER